jgi:Ran GTPase-activating protein (RanGAP) involved in mRNA processing and transport
MQFHSDLARDLHIAACKDTGESPSAAGMAVVAAALAESPEGTLQLSHCRLGVHACITLAKRCASLNVHTLDVSHNLVRDVGAMALLQLVRANSGVQNLILSCNDISTEGALAIAEELTRNRSLKRLELGTTSEHSLHDNYIGADSGGAIATALIHNSTLEYLGLNRNLVGRGVRSGPEAFGALLRAPDARLQELAIGHNSLGPRGCSLILSGLAENRSLRILDLSGNGLNASAAGTLALALGSRHSVLETLILRDNDLGPSGCAAIASAFANNVTLRSLDLSGNGIGDEGLSALSLLPGAFTHLTDFRLARSGLTKAALPVLAACLAVSGAIRVLDLQQNSVASGVTALATVLGQGRLPNLERLDLTSCRIGDDDALALCEAISGHSSLRLLRFRDNFLGPGGGDRCAAALMGSSSLHICDFRSNQLGHAANEKIAALCRRNKHSIAQHEPQQLAAERAELSAEHARLRAVADAATDEAEAADRARAILQQRAAAAEDARELNEEIIARLDRDLEQHGVAINEALATVAERSAELVLVAERHEQDQELLQVSAAAAARKRAETEAELAASLELEATLRQESAALQE